MTTLGTALRPAATRVMLLGSGELGKEVALECQRLGVEVIAVDCYADAPAMHVAHRSHVINMLDGAALAALIAEEKPDFVVPEIEAIATETLVELEQQGQRVVPTARAARLTMNREGIRRLAAEELSLPTSRYRFADSKARFDEAATEIGFPCIVKPVMSSSGKGQSFIRDASQLDNAWTMRNRVAARVPDASSSKRLSTSISRSPCSPSAQSMAFTSVRRLVTVRRMAIIVNPAAAADE